MAPSILVQGWVTIAVHCVLSNLFPARPFLGFLGSVCIGATVTKWLQPRGGGGDGASTAAPLARRREPYGVRDVVVGTSPLGGVGRRMDDGAAVEIVARCVALGFRDFDTAPHYGLGVSETRLGDGLRAGCARVAPSEAAAALLLREEIRVFTKVGRLVVARGALKDGDEVEADNVPGCPETIYLDSPPDVVPVLDYSAAGARRSYRESAARLGAGVKIYGLRVHDPESPARERAALAGSLPGLAQLRRDEGISASVGLNDAGVCARLVEACNPQNGSGDARLDGVMLAGRWHLLDQSGAAVLRTCAARGVDVTVAGAYASGFLAGGPTYEYGPASAALVAKRDAWARLAAEFDADLITVALAFAFLPAAVTRVALGLAKAEHADATPGLLERARAVPDALWAEAVERGLLPSGLV